MIQLSNFESDRTSSFHKEKREPETGWNRFYMKEKLFAGRYFLDRRNHLFIYHENKFSKLLE